MGRTQGKPEACSLRRHPDGANEEEEDAKKEEEDDGDGIRKMGIGQATDGRRRNASGRWEPPQCLDIGAPPPGIAPEPPAVRYPGRRNSAFGITAYNKSQKGGEAEHPEHMSSGFKKS